MLNTDSKLKNFVEMKIQQSSLIESPSILVLDNDSVPHVARLKLILYVMKATN